MSQKITRDMTFNQILQLGPETAEVLAKYKLECVGCLGASIETLEQGARLHGLDVDEIVTALNEALTD